MSDAQNGHFRRTAARKRLDVPEVHALLAATGRMLDEWAEAPEGGRERRRMWREVHRAADELAERAYGGPKLTVRLSYWLRPYDMRLNRRVWRWRRPGPCRVIDPTEASS